MTILIVDDEQEILDNMYSMLKPSGYDCNTTVNPIEALALYQKNKYDLVITDIKMPGMNGIDLLKNIKEFDPVAKVIVITAYGDLETAISAINYQAFYFFSKPLNFKELITVLRNIENKIVGEQTGNKDYLSIKKENEELKKISENLYKEISLLKEKSRK